jgi:hypothetical protein
MKRTFIRIIATPPGEAPEEIRRAWIGVRLPLLVFHKQAKDWRSAGVLTGPKSFLARFSGLFSGRFQRHHGYAVSVVEAISALEAANPAAAKWWRENTPHAVRPGKAFVFAAEVCVVETELTTAN